MDNKKGITSFLEFIIAIIIIIPVVFVIFIIFVLGVGSIKAVTESPQAYVSETAAALTTGESVVVGSLAPSLTGSQFMAQFYGGTSCISLLDQLSRTGVLTTPADPATLSDSYFVCFGSYKTNDLIYSTWNDLPTSSFNASFPDWFPAANYLNSRSSLNSSGINGSQGTLSFFFNLNTLPSYALASSCESFLNATTTIGKSEPSAYISSINCVPIPTEGNTSIFISVKSGSCTNGCTSNPLAFLHGSPGAISLQSCTYTGGDSLLCQFDIR